MNSYKPFCMHDTSAFRPPMSVTVLRRTLFLTFCRQIFCALSSSWVQISLCWTVMALLPLFLFITLFNVCFVCSATLLNPLLTLSTNKMYGYNDDILITFAFNSLKIWSHVYRPSAVIVQGKRVQNSVNIRRHYQACRYRLISVEQ